MAFLIFATKNFFYFYDFKRGCLGSPIKKNYLTKAAQKEPFKKGFKKYN